MLLPLSVAEEIELRIRAYEMTGNGVSDMAALLRRAKERIEDLERPINERVALFRETRALGRRSKYPCHPDCKRCERSREIDLAAKRRLGQRKRDGTL
jgi:hypothetical protein